MAVSVVTMQLIYVSVQVPTSVAFLHVFRCYFVTSMLVDLSVAILQVTLSVAVKQLDVSAAHMQVTASAAKMWVTIVIVIMQMGVLCRWLFSAGHYAHYCIYCNYASDFLNSYVGDSFK